MSWVFGVVLSKREDWLGEGIEVGRAVVGIGPRRAVGKEKQARIGGDVSVEGSGERSGLEGQT